MVGTGPAFTLYEVVNALFATVQTEDRLFTDEETARIESIYRETYAL
ncbi:hypothetical protein ACTD5D_04210 [Nocardia takedensis]|nr:hypothetical protein [Nocardia takedensis]